MNIYMLILCYRECPLLSSIEKICSSTNRIRWSLGSRAKATFFSNSL